MPRQDVESRRRHEDAVLGNALALPSRLREDEEEEYDVYFFWPSSPTSCAALSERLAQGELADARSLRLRTWAAPSEPALQPSSPALRHLYGRNEDENGASAHPSVYRPSVDSQDDIQPSFVTPPPSPTYSFISDYVFPEREHETEMDVAGYSRVFTAGLTLKPCSRARSLVTLEASTATCGAFLPGRLG
ncbi:uncharacterized protein PHACADRAFT_247445 [Phanerochaete carnosa HHB-10118-sp]|uniref:Uncharacterized protein n=1 Tax=Phanerochaete carnosa (strain HHB-10118-sp) TaxID=650164 RepID=K5WPB9_PHACS|nr:uncharacterized protein PHACADRAFT_247445 [Phanerochaete carnosa HHB-10118-sp]EKM61079.1 hypothetical protein PHACADRAFT_247445 [Phanerochaete carnosa HHB-10118-sp]